MTETPKLSIYESTFAQSDKTDAILVVEGKKLHVNKAFLSHHSDYFDNLFNSDYKDQHMPEIHIEKVKFNDLATVLSLVHKNPISFNYYGAEPFLKLVNQFQLPAAKRYLDLFLASSPMDKNSKMVFADKYKLDTLFVNTLCLYQKQEDFVFSRAFLTFSDETKIKFFNRQASLAEY